MRRFRCVECGGMFTTSVHTARYCSEDCRRARQQKQQQAWKVNNPDYMKNYMREYRKKRGDRVANDHEAKNKRTCSQCGIEKELTADNFVKHKQRKGGFDNLCKACKKVNDAERYNHNRDKILKQKKEYYQQNKEHIKERQLKYHHSKKAHFN